MGFSLSSLGDYTNQLNKELIGVLHFDNTSSKYFTPQGGIKSSEALQLIDVSAVPHADGCTPNPTGDVSLTQRNITVGAIRYEDTLCPPDLNTKWTQVYQPAGANASSENIWFEQEIHDQVIALIKEHNETRDWQGDTTSGSAFLNSYNGLIKIIDTAGTAITGNTGGVTSGTGITSGSSGNVDTIIYAMCDARSTALKTKPDQVLFCGTGVFDKMVNTLVAKNNFHIDATGEHSYEMRIPGRNVKLVGVPGLDGTNRMFLGRTRNFFLGFDLANDFEMFKIWYSMDDSNVKYRVRFKRGVQVARPSEIVQFKLV